GRRSGSARNCAGHPRNATRVLRQTGLIVSPETRIGHVHLKVSDLDRSERFYIEVLGMERTTRLGDQASFLAYGDYHHHLGLNVWHSKGKPPAPVEAAGLYHFAILYPSRKDLAIAVKRVFEKGWTIDG